MVLLKEYIWEKFASSRIISLNSLIHVNDFLL